MYICRREDVHLDSPSKLMTLCGIDQGLDLGMYIYIYIYIYLGKL